IASLSQDIIKKVYTDKTIYAYGETVFITIRAINESSIPDTIVFPNTCEAYPFIDDNDYLMTFTIGCYTAITRRIIPPKDSVEWIYQYPPSSQSGKFLSIGLHNVYGHFQDYQGYCDTMVVSNTDTSYFYVKQGISMVEKEEENNSFVLEQNYPNPFNPITKINYFVPQISFVTLKIFDMLGKEIATLVNEEKPAGSYEVEFNTVETYRDASLPSGVYFYRLQAGNFSDTRKLVLIK
ncbi:MAG: T9SS type A sorting domain-containing protein, partial [Ignavibacteriaceae bacterium]|nr:T9SS type A sorting domain-containing protein [Ignavibacteriaceae bacterium]